MTISSDMAEAAGKAKLILGNSTSLVAEFLNGQISPNGGFSDRSQKSDLYYTVFGLGGLMAVGDNFDNSGFYDYINAISPENLPDLVHLASYIRCCALLEMPVNSLNLAELLTRFITPDGGFDNVLDSKSGNIYSCFLAMGAYHDIDQDLPEKPALLNCIKSLQLENGGFANLHGVSAASVPATAAALVIYHSLGKTPDDEALQWMLEQYDRGGFIAAEAVGIPDMLSTAVALHSLALNGVYLKPLKNQTLDFIDSLWSNRGGFSGNWLDNTIDCEYTYYGLLALGNLADA